MKPKRSNPLFARCFRHTTLAAAIVFSLAGFSAKGAVQTYQDGNALNTWNTADANWDAGVAWTDGNSATFAGIGESVTVSAVNASGITFDSTGYTLTGGTITLGVSPATITANANATIASVIAGGVAVDKAGSGILSLSGQSTFTGPLNVTAGTVHFPTAYSGGSRTVSAAVINLAPSTALTCNGAAFGWYANNNAGGCTINIDGADCQANGAFGVAYTLKGGTISGGNGQRLDLGKSSTFNTSITSYASATTSVINPATQVMLRGDSGQTSYPFTVADGDAAIDLDIQKPINHNSTSSGIVKNGAGVMRLNSTANGYSGPTTINGGSLVLGLATSTIANSSALTIAPGSLLDTSAITAGYNVASGRTLTAGDANSTADIIGNLTLAAGTGAIKVAGDGTVGILSVDGNLTLNGGVLPVDQAAGVIDKIHLAGSGRTLTLSGTNTVSGFLPAGTYTLIDGFSSSSGTSANFAYTGGSRGSTGTFTINPSDVTLEVSAGTPLALTWSGTTNGVWDVTTTANWNGGAATFFTADDVTFADSPVTSTVTIAGTVRPGSMAFTNATTAYTVRGGTNPVIAGTGSLTKTGAATVTLWHPSNTFSGGTSISDGTISINSGAGGLASGTYTPLGTGTITINAGGTLELNPQNLTNPSNTITIPNAVTLNGGALYQNDCFNHIGGLVTVTAPSVIRGHYGTKDLWLDGGLAGSESLKISNLNGGYGPGAVHIGTDGTYSGTLTVDNLSTNLDGSLVVRSNNALQSASLVLNTTASTQGGYNVGLTLAGSSTNVTIAGLSGTSPGARIHNGDATTRTLTINQSADSTFAGGIGDGTGNGDKIGIVKAGTGTLTLAGQDTYAGNTTVTGGKLVMNTRSSQYMNILVDDGAALGINSTGVSLLINDMTLGASGATTLSIVNFPSNASVPVIDAINVANNSNTTVSVSGSLSVGTYPLISYTALSGPGTFVLAPLPRGVVGNISDSGSSIDLNITGFNQLIWKGNAGNVWDINNTLNWKLGATDPDKYLDGDNVLFDGSATGTAVELDTTVAPGSVTFTFDDPASYSLTGSGSISGATGIVKNGTGTLTLGTANSFNGIVALNGGILVLESPSALGSTVSGTTVTGGARLELNGQSIGSESIALAGALTNNSATASSLGGSFSLTGDSSIGGSGDLNLASAITGSSALEKSGAGTLTLASQSSAFSGTVTVSGGTLVVAAFRSLENAPLVIGNGGTVSVTADNGFQWHTQPVTIKSGGTLSLASGRTSNIGPSGALTMEGGATLAGATPNGYWGSWTINNGSGTSVLTVAGGDPVAAEISANLVTPSQPVLNLNVSDVTGSPAADLLVSGSLGTPASTGFGVTINGGGTVLFTSTNTYTGTTTVEAGSTLGGNGTLASPLNVAGTVAPGISGLGTLSSGSLVLTGTYSCQVDVATSDSLSVSGNLDITGATLACSTTVIPGAASYVIASYTGTLTGTFATETGVPSGYSVQYDTANKQIKLVKPGYATWADSWTEPVLSDKTPGGDPDNDGITNLLEYILGGDPRVSSTSILPTASIIGSNLVLEYTRNDDSESDTTQVGQWSTDLGTWTDVAPVMVNENAAAPDDMSVTVPLTNAVDGKLFLRLKAGTN